MENEELIKQIERSQTAKNDQETAVEGNTVKFIVFLVGDKKYALYAGDIREIILDYPLFYVPFVPPYVRGFINRHGEPHTVLDLNVLFEQVKLESSTFLVLNRDNDQLAIIISEILEIAELPDEHVHLITEETGDEGFFLGSITSGEKETFIVDLQKVLERLERDLEAE